MQKVVKHSGGEQKALVGADGERSIAADVQRA